MPRTTKEAKSDDEKIVKKKATTTKKAVVEKDVEVKPKKTTTKKATTSTKKETAKKTTTKKATVKKETETKPKKATTKSAEKPEKDTVKKSSSTKKTSTEKKSTTKSKKTTKSEDKEKKVTTKKSSSTKKTSAEKKSTTTKKTVTKVKTASPEDFSIAEYYDLPYNYDKTVIKVLAQTPNTLFVYWEISDADRKNYAQQYGENFFEVTKPVLIVQNITRNYSFEVDINDFANCWYLNVNDSQDEYKIELGRRPIKNIENTINKNYIYVSSSNEIEAPNDRILFDPNQKMVYFKNVKTNDINTKSINFSYMKNMGKIYNIYDIYKEIYKDENIEEFDLSNPSSKGNPSSTFK